MKARLLVGVILALSLAGANAAEDHTQAYETIGHPWKRFHYGKDWTEGTVGALMAHGEALGLTDEQLGKLVRLKLQETQACRDRKGQLHQKMRRVLDGLKNPVMESAAVQEATKQYIEAYQAMVDHALDLRNKARGLLTPQQLDRLKALMVPGEEPS